MSIVLAVAGAAGCGGASRQPAATAREVAALLRHAWGSTKGSPSFTYSCRPLDGRGRLFTCVARDATGTVRVASFDVVCDARCTWTDYPSYSG